MVFEFETCAICIETQEILGCVKWGFSKISGGEIQLTGGRLKDFSLKPSGEFQAAADKWNEVAMGNRRTGGFGPQSLLGTAHANSNGQRMGPTTASPTTTGIQPTQEDLMRRGKIQAPEVLPPGVRGGSFEGLDE